MFNYNKKMLILKYKIFIDIKNLDRWKYYYRNYYYWGNYKTVYGLRFCYSMFDNHNIKNSTAQNTSKRELFWKG